MNEAKKFPNQYANDVNSGYMGTYEEWEPGYIKKFGIIRVDEKNFAERPGIITHKVDIDEWRKEDDDPFPLSVIKDMTGGDYADNLPFEKNPVNLEDEQEQKPPEESTMTIKTNGTTEGLFRIRKANECMEDAKSQPIPRALYGELVFEGEVTFLFADTGKGKSIYAVQIANEISKTDKVLYLDLELSDKQFQNRYSENYQNEYVFNDNFYRVDFTRRFEIPEGTTYDEYFLQSLDLAINATGAKIVIIDNMTKLISSDTDTAKAAKPLMDKLKAYNLDNGITFLLLEHTKKIDEYQPISLNHLQGSKMKVNFGDAAFAIGASAKGSNIRYIKQLKCRSAEIKYDGDNVMEYEVIKMDSFLQLKPTGNYGYEADHLKQREKKSQDPEIKARILELSASGKSEREISEIVDLPKTTVRNIIIRGKSQS